MFFHIASITDNKCTQKCTSENVQITAGKPSSSTTNGGLVTVAIMLRMRSVRTAACCTRCTSHREACRGFLLSPFFLITDSDMSRFQVLRHHLDATVPSHITLAKLACNTHLSFVRCEMLPHFWQLRSCRFLHLGPVSSFLFKFPLKMPPPQRLQPY